ncbi:MAG: hypothetical protein ACD_28C00142G0002 [uncultured bacterium]|nr:MAG: hypothetical protein ACD_28C00142G0002 [uncultured bacterium]KKT77027.1 MAG: hypothetical protein UW70_C0005G0007 [Candidatus Peregrinibacteria bacterium GW2011_GWA2_44_7]
MKKIALLLTLTAVSMFVALPVASAGTWAWFSDRVENRVCNSAYWNGHAEALPEFCK